MGGDVEVAGPVAIGHRPEIGAAPDRWTGPSHGAIGECCFAFGVELDVTARIVVDRFAGLRVDTLSPGHILDVLGRLEELAVQAVETVGEAVAAGMGDDLAVFAVDLGINQNMGASLIVIAIIVRCVWVPQVILPLPALNAIALFVKRLSPGRKLKS